jgi:hypothetical protein
MIKNIKHTTYKNINDSINYMYNEHDIQQIKDKILEVLIKSFKRKIIFYTSTYLSCLQWYENISNDIQFNNYNKHIAFSICKSKNHIDNYVDNYTLNDKVNYKKDELNISDLKLSKGIDNFKSDNENSFLFVVCKATEGYNDKLVDIAFNLDPVFDRSINLELQKMGRTTRIFEETGIQPKKETGLYITPIIKNENYEENMSNFMADFINAIIKPITNSKSNDETNTSLLSISEYNYIYNNIFNIEGFIEIEHKNIYDLVLRKTNPDITYKKAIQIIRNTYPKPNNIEEYNNLTNIDTRLPKNPQDAIEFSMSHFNWIEYLSIEQKYYNLNEAKQKINLFFKNNASFYSKSPSIIMNELSRQDNMFPPTGLWSDYYKISLSELIKIPIKK